MYALEVLRTRLPNSRVPELQRLRDVLRDHGVGAGEISDRSGDPQDAVVAAR